jgi:hypothetical protein
VSALAPKLWLVQEDERPNESRELLVYKIDQLGDQLQQGVRDLGDKIDGLGSRVTALENWRAGVDAVFAASRRQGNTFRDWLIAIVAIGSLAASVLIALL